MRTSAEHCVIFFKKINKLFDKFVIFHSEYFVLTRTDAESSCGFLFLIQRTLSIDKGSTYYNIY